MSQTLAGSLLPTSSAGHWLYAAVAVLTLLALWALLRCTRHLRRRRVLRAAGGLAWALVFAALAAAALAVGLNLLTYARLTAERPVAELSFRRLAPQVYAVTLTDASGRRLHATLSGDDWQLDARVVKWTGWATVLGLPTLYRLERLEGRYENLRQAQTTLPTVVGLARDPGLPLTELERTAPWLPLVDARYGSATYLPMADGAAYRVTLSTTGLLARPANAAAKQAVAAWR